MITLGTGGRARDPRQLRSLHRVERVVLAARSVIATKGYAGLTMSELAKVAGISLGSIYQYYPNRSAVLRRLAATQTAAFSQRICTPLNPEPQSIAELEATLRSLLEEFYLLHLGDPVLRDIWMGVEADRAFRDQARQDTDEKTAILVAAVSPLYPGLPKSALDVDLRLMLRFATAATRIALDLPALEGRRVIDRAKQVLPYILRPVIRSASA